MYTEVFSPESKTSWFNRAFDQIRHDKRVVELLGETKKIKAYGEVNDSSWRKTRPVQSFVKKDQYGTEHLMMHFYVSLPYHGLRSPKGANNYCRLRAHWTEEKSMCIWSGSRRKASLFTNICIWTFQDDSDCISKMRRLIQKARQRASRSSLVTHLDRSLQWFDSHSWSPDTMKPIALEIAIVQLNSVTELSRHACFTE